MSRRPKPIEAAPREQSRLKVVLEAGLLKATAKNQSATGMMMPASSKQMMQAQQSWPDANDAINADSELKEWVNKTTKNRAGVWQITRIPRSNGAAEMAFYKYHRENRIKVEALVRADYYYYLFGPIDKHDETVVAKYAMYVEQAGLDTAMI